MSKVRPRSGSIATESTKKRQYVPSADLAFADTHLEDNKLVKRTRKTVDDPNLVLVSKSTPRKQLLTYILDRLTSEKNETCEPRSVVLLASNSAMQSCISIAEIVKRRVPEALYRVDIGTTYSNEQDGTGKAYALRIEFKTK